MKDIANLVIGNLLKRLIDRLKDKEDIDAASYITALLDMWEYCNTMAIIDALDKENKEASNEN